jgi:hypothetical protein
MEVGEPDIEATYPARAFQLLGYWDNFLFSVKEPAG